MGGRRPGAALPALALGSLAALAMTACGERSPDASEQVASAVADLRDSFDAGAMDEVCVGMSAPAQSAAIEASGGTPRSCRRALATLLDPAKRTTSAYRSGQREVLSVKVRGDRATATVTLNSRAPGTLSLAREGDRWVLADLRVPPVRKGGWKEVTSDWESFEVWRVRGGRREMCPPVNRVTYSGNGTVAGGCSFRVDSDDAPLVMLTAFGDFEVARCRGGYLLYFDNTGNVIAHDVAFSGPEPCGQIAHCQDGETGLRYPWLGQKIPWRKGAVGLRLDICVNTSVGRVRGMQIVELKRVRGEWRAEPADYPVGNSNLQIGGSWDLDPDDLGIRAREYATVSP